MCSSTNHGSEVAVLRDRIKELESSISRIEHDRIEYLQNVSHQLVAPLNAMKWHIENLTNGRLGVDRAKKVLRSIYSQATIAVHLAKNFALMSNLEADHALSALKEPLQEVDLCRLLINIADDFQPFGWDRNIKIVVDDSDFNLAPPVLAMKPLVSQVFSNIVENAVKYSNDDTTIEITGIYDQESTSVIVEIANKGIGIERDEIKMVFDRAYRSARAKMKYPAGTGFGLYIAKKIVDLHRGNIETYTDSNGFTVFAVHMPIRALAGETRTVERIPADKKKVK